MNKIDKIDTRLGNMLLTGLKELGKPYSNDGFLHLEVALQYLAAQGMIRYKLKSYLILKSKQLELKVLVRNDYDITKDAVEFITKLAKELKKTLAVEEFDSIIDVLNTHKVPECIVALGHTKMAGGKDLFIYDDNLYYTTFRSNATEAIYSISKMGVLLSPELDEDNERSSLRVPNIGGVIGYDNENHIVFCASLDGEYVIEFDMETGMQTIVPMKPIDMLAGNCLLGVYEGYLSYKLGDLIVPVTEYSDNCRYAGGDNGMISVHPNLIRSEFFKPYMLSLDGVRIEYEDKYVKNYLWRGIHDSIIYGFIDDAILEKDPEQKERLAKKYYRAYTDEFDINKVDNTCPDIISISGMTEKLLDEYGLPELCLNSRFNAFDMIMNKFIARFVSGDEDITDIMYLLCAAGLKNNQYSQHPFEVGFVNKTIELSIRHDKTLEYYLENLNKPGVKNDFIKEYDRSDEGDVFMPSGMRKEYDKPCVGYFNVVGKAVYADKIEKADSDIIGYTRYKKNNENDFKGSVTFSLIDSSYVIQYPEPLDEDVRGNIRSMFDIRFKECNFVIAG